MNVVEAPTARSSWRVYGARVDESAPERVRRGAIRFARRLRVDREREPRIGVTEAGLRGLEIHAIEHERRRVGPAKVMEGDARSGFPPYAEHPT